MKILISRVISISFKKEQGTDTGQIMRTIIIKNILESRRIAVNPENGQGGGYGRELGMSGY